MSGPSTAPPEPAAGDRWAQVLVVGSAVAVTVAIVARFVAGSPLWLDEALSVNIASKGFSGITEALRSDGHPPLYYWLLHVWMEAFGSSDASVRALSGLCSVAALAGCWQMGRELARDLPGSMQARWAPWCVAVVAAVTPWSVRYGTEARMYALVTVEVVIGWWCLRRSVRGGSRRWLIGVALSTGALLLTHYWALYLVAAAVMVLSVRWWRAGAQRRRFVAPLAAVLLGCLAFVPWLPVFGDQLAHTGTPWAPPARPTVVVSTTITDLGGFSADAAVFGLVIVVAALVGVFVRPNGQSLELLVTGRPETRREAAMVALTLGIASVAMVVGRSAFASRYAAVIVPMVVVLAGLGVAALGTARRISIALVVVVILAVPGIAYNVRTDRTQGGDVVAYLRAAAAPGDVVAYCPDQIGPAFSRGLDEPADLQLVRYPDLGDPSLVDWRDYADRNAANDPGAFATELLERGEGRTIWFAFSPGYRTLEGQCEAVYATLAAVRTDEQVIGTARGVFEPGALARFAP